MTLEAYGTEPVLIVLSDGVPRAVRFTAAALRRLAKRQTDLVKDPSATTVDHMVAVVWEGIVDKAAVTAEAVNDQGEKVALTGIDAIAELIDARSIEYLNTEIAKVLPAAVKNAPAPASEA